MEDKIITQEIHYVTEMVDADQDLKAPMDLIPKEHRLKCKVISVDVTYKTESQERYKRHIVSYSIPIHESDIDKRIELKLKKLLTLEEEVSNLVEKAKRFTFFKADLVDRVFYKGNLFTKGSNGHIFSDILGYLAIGLSFPLLLGFTIALTRCS